MFAWVCLRGFSQWSHNLLFFGSLVPWLSSSSHHVFFPFHHGNCSRPRFSRGPASQAVSWNPVLPSFFLSLFRRGRNFSPFYLLTIFDLSISSIGVPEFLSRIAFPWCSVGNSGWSSIGLPDLSSHLVSGRLSYVSLSINEKPSLIPAYQPPSTPDKTPSSCSSCWRFGSCRSFYVQWSCCNHPTALSISRCSSELWATEYNFNQLSAMLSTRSSMWSSRVGVEITKPST